MADRSRGPVRLGGGVRLLGLPVSTVARYWGQERLSLSRGLVALALAATADLAAGLVLGSAEGEIVELPGLLMLIPAAIAMRGATFGALGARLSTAIHTGQFERELRRGSYLWHQLEAAGILTLTTSVEVALLARVLTAALRLTSVSLWDLVVVSVLGGMLASVVLVVVTVSLSRAAHSRGWNMADVGAPTITATGDLVTIPALLAAALLAEQGAVTLTLAALLVVGSAAALVRGWRHPRPEVRRVVRESAIVLTLAAAVSVMAGLVIETRSTTFLTLPALLVLFPPFVASFGGIGGILASRLTAKLHLGLLEPRPLPGRLAVLDVSAAYLLGVLVFAFTGVATWATALVTGLAAPSFWTLLGVALTGGLFGITIVAVVAYTVSAATYRFGLDPDNHAIPIITSVMDLLGMLCLVAALALYGVG